MEEVLILDIGAWDARLNVVITDDINRCIESQGKIKGFNTEKYLLTNSDDYDGVVITFEEKEFTGVAVLFIYSKMEDRVIVHETSHAAFHILDARGVELNKHTTEAFAYLEEYIFSKIKKFFEQVKKKIEFKHQPELPLIWQEVEEDQGK